MVKNPEEVFKRFESLHEKVANLYESVIDEESTEALELIEGLEQELQELKKEL